MKIDPPRPESEYYMFLRLWQTQQILDLPVLYDLSVPACCAQETRESRKIQCLLAFGNVCRVTTFFMHMIEVWLLIPQVRPAHKYPNSPWEMIHPPWGYNTVCM
jgi:hypothetical protein